MLRNTLGDNMNYVSEDALKRLQPLVNEIIPVIIDGNDTKFVKGEYFGFFVNRLIKGYLLTLDKEAQSFNSSVFNPIKLPKLKLTIDKLLSVINKDDPLASAGELRWAIETVTEAVNAIDSTYGFKAYLLGAIEQVRNDMEKASFSNTEQKNRLMNFRRYCVTLGVINDVLHTMRS